MYTLLDCIKHKCRDSYALYKPTVTSVRLVQTYMTFPPPATCTHNLKLSFRVVFLHHSFMGPTLFKNLKHFWYFKKKVVLTN